MKKISVVTGTRAEYGLLNRLIKMIDASAKFELQLIVTGAHLEKKYGETYREIENDGFSIERKIKLELSGDRPLDIAKSTASGLTKFAEVFDVIQPDLLLLLGDRYEVFSAAQAAMFLGLPIAHIHGGELTEGAIDDCMRHSITKMSHLHFVANDEYRARVIQMGEDPSRVHNVGGLGVDAILNANLLERYDLEKALKIKLKKRNILVTYHPVTLEKNKSNIHLTQLLAALSSLEDTCVIFTMPNADADNGIIFELIEQYATDHNDVHVFTSLGRLLYLSCLAQFDLVLGNSSSGITEAPTLKTATINVGDRQRGRIQSSSIINCRPIKHEILHAVETVFTKEFQLKLSQSKNPYGNGGASDKILSILEEVNFEGLLKKQFYNIKM